MTIPLCVSCWLYLCEIGVLAALMACRYDELMSQDGDHISLVEALYHYLNTSELMHA